jgi:hypothetical protein
VNPGNLPDRVLDWFTAWFQSRRGVWHTFALTVVVTVVEIVFPHMDPNGFKWLYICTVWSFFTQNALANSSREDGEKVSAQLVAIKAEEDQILACPHCGGPR